MANKSMGISRKILIFNTIVVTLVVILTAAVCVFQFKGELVKEANDSQEKRLKIFWELLKQKGTDVKVVDGKLMAGNYVINNNFELPDKLKDLSGGVATIFMGDERVSTNITGTDGKRAIGTKLAPGPAYDSVFIQGKPYYGEAEILKENYFTAYEPIKSSKGEIIGVLFVGTKQSEFLATFMSMMIPIFVIAVALVFVTGFLSVFIVRKIMSPLKEVADLTARVAEGDLTVSIQASSDDEIGNVLSSMEKMSLNLKQLIGDIKASADTIASGARQLKTSSDKIAVNINAETAQTNQIATSAEEMSQTVIDIAKNSSNIAISSSEAAKTARAGEEVVNRSIAETEKIASAVNDSSQMMIVLGEKSREIGAIIEVINDIADQTNLLALNAAIEAARAGEQGRGFAVVADEVRKLAERTAKSTAQISEMIGAIQQEVDKAVSSMQGASERVQSGVSLSKETGAALSAIVHTVNDLQSMVQQIASATEQMSSVSEHISGDINSIAGETKGISSDVNNITNASSELEQLATKLQGHVAKFRV